MLFELFGNLTKHCRNKQTILTVLRILYPEYELDAFVHILKIKHSDFVQSFFCSMNEKEENINEMAFYF